MKSGQQGRHSKRGASKAGGSQRQQNGRAAIGPQGRGVAYQWCRSPKPHQAARSTRAVVGGVGALGWHRRAAAWPLGRSATWHAPRTLRRHGAVQSRRCPATPPAAVALLPPRHLVHQPFAMRTTLQGPQNPALRRGTSPPVSRQLHRRPAAQQALPLSCRSPCCAQPRYLAHQLLALHKAPKGASYPACDREVALSFTPAALAARAREAADAVPPISSVLCSMQAAPRLPHFACSVHPRHPIQPRPGHHNRQAAVYKGAPGGGKAEVGGWGPGASTILRYSA